MPDTPVSNLLEFTVTSLSAALKRAVEDQFAFVRVRGEISGLKFHSSGHVYFDLKDDKAVLNAVIWRGNTARLKIRPEAGMEVICTGKLSTYAGSSRYQLIVEQVELAGLGALMAMLEERRKKLAAEGLFDASRKKKLPFLPDVIGVITSPTGAVIRDIMHRLEARFPRRVLLWPVAVQGDKAAAEIAAAITGFNAFGAHLPKPDLIIVARGGGSVEDLMAFNEEAVVRAAAASMIALISAVGHETDTTLIDFAADIRAPTPTAAAELAVPVRTEILAQTMDFERRMLTCFSKGLKDRQRHLAQLVRVLPKAESLFAGPRQRLDQASERLGQSLRKNLQVHRVQFFRAEAQLRTRMLKDRMTVCGERVAVLGTRAERAQRARLAQARRQLDGLTRVLDSVSHKSVLERGFALVRGEDGKVRRRAAAVKLGEALTLSFADGDTPAMAEGGGARGKTKKPADQGSLF
ncbi:MAG: exodeoxyribonuclease VII large subunit [Alphaproteobacteria bacterium]|nr:exodeoxyribonuclease VII large subunit [Alphaproteobacteria bacterium]